jgi:hypothetical protein
MKTSQLAHNNRMHSQNANKIIELVRKYLEHKKNIKESIDRSIQPNPEVRFVSRLLIVDTRTLPFSPTPANLTL